MQPSASSSHLWGRYDGFQILQLNVSKQRQSGEKTRTETRESSRDASASRCRLFFQKGAGPVDTQVLSTDIARRLKAAGCLTFASPLP